MGNDESLNNQMSHQNSFLFLRANPAQKSFPLACYISAQFEQHEERKGRITMTISVSFLGRGQKAPIKARDWTIGS
jgi:hypothetical protein